MRENNIIYDEITRMANLDNNFKELEELSEDAIVFEKKYSRAERRKMLGGNGKYKAHRSAARAKVKR